MADEVIGGVAVQITGDVSQLNAILGNAVSIAGVAGGKVASAFNTGAAATSEFSAATETAAAAEGEFAGATEIANAALGHQVSQLQATSGAIRTALGEQSIRAAERFLTMIPGLGAALQVAFPVIGAVALFEAISRVVGKSEDLKAALKEQQTQAEATNKADEELVRTLDRIGVAGIGRQFGGGAEATAQANLLKAQAQDVGNEILGIESKIRGLKAQTTGKLIGGPSADVVAAQVAAEEEKINQALDKQQGLYAQAGQAALEAGQKRQTEAGQLSSAQIAQQESVNAHLAALNKAYSDESIEQAHSAVQLQIAAMHDREAAAVSTEAEELRVAQAKEQAITQALASEVPKRIALIRAGGAAKAAGKSAPEQARIGVETQTKVGDYQAEADQKTLAAHAETAKAQSALDIAQTDRSRQVAEQLATAWERSYDAITAAAKKTQDEVDAGVEKQLQTQLRVAEIQDKSAGEVKALQIQGQKIALEAQYGAQVSHTLAQQIDYLQQIAAIDSQINNAKLAGLQADLATAQAAADDVRDETKIAQLQAQIAALKQQGPNQQAQVQRQVADTQAKSGLGPQLGNAAQSGAASLANALAEGIVKGGKGLGKDIRESLQNIGKQMLGDAIKTGVEDMVIAITGNTIATNVNTLWTQILALAQSLFGFADGTDSAPGGMALVGEKGPEIVNLPRGSQVIPNHAIKGYANGTSYSSTAFQTGTTNLHFHVHGMSNPDQFIEHVVRKLPDKLKARSPQFGPYSR